MPKSYKHKQRSGHKSPQSERATVIKARTHRPNCWTSGGPKKICLPYSAALEAFRAAWTLSAPIQHVKSEEVGCRPSEPLDSLIGCVPAV